MYLFNTLECVAIGKTQITSLHGTGRQGQLSGDEFWLAEVVNCVVVAGADLSRS